MLTTKHAGLSWLHLKNAARICPTAVFIKTQPLVLAYSHVCKNTAIDPSGLWSRVLRHSYKRGLKKHSYRPNRSIATFLVVLSLFLILSQEITFFYNGNDCKPPSLYKCVNTTMLSLQKYAHITHFYVPYIYLSICS